MRSSRFGGGGKTRRFLMARARIIFRAKPRKTGNPALNGGVFCFSDYQPERPLKRHRARPTTKSKKSALPPVVLWPRSHMCEGCGRVPGSTPRHHRKDDETTHRRAKGRVAQHTNPRRTTRVRCVCVSTSEAPRRLSPPSGARSLVTLPPRPRPPCPASPSA